MDSAILTFDTPAEEMPLSERIVLRNGIATFENQYQEGFDSDLNDDLKFLRNVDLGLCGYGACDCKVYPFACSASIAPGALPKAQVVLLDLYVKDFKSEHIERLDVASVPFPGYHPNTDNDEIHSDPEEQHIFSKPEHDAAGHASHIALRDHVLDQHLYYVLLHTAKKPCEDFEYSEWVILFALGVSKRSRAYVGAVTHQACHNLCD